MSYRNLGRTLFVLGALFLSVSVLGQGRGKGNGSGQGSGREHKEKEGQKKTYKNIRSVEVLSEDGTVVYPSKGKKSGGKKDEVGPEIEKVESTQNGIRIYFVSKNEDQRVIEVLCKDCVVLIDHSIPKRATGAR